MTTDQKVGSSNLLAHALKKYPEALYLQDFGLFYSYKSLSHSDLTSLSSQESLLPVVRKLGCPCDDCNPPIYDGPAELHEQMEEHQGGGGGTSSGLSSESGNGTSSNS